MARTKLPEVEPEAKEIRFEDPELQKHILDVVRTGVPLLQAAMSVGVAKRTLNFWKQRARSGSAPHVAFLERVEMAEAQCEARHVSVTAVAAWPQRKNVSCQGCGKPVEVDLAQVEGTQRIYSDAARNAMAVLQTRFPERWSPTMRIQVEEEQSRFLDVFAEWCRSFAEKHGERLGLSAEQVQESFLDAYVAALSPGEASDAEGGEAGEAIQH